MPFLVGNALAGVDQTVLSEEVLARAASCYAAQRSKSLARVVWSDVSRSAEIQGTAEPRTSGFPSAHLDTR